jgi:hypothetical protein
VPSTLSRIAQESLVPDLPEDTGALTAADVQDLEGVGQSMSDPSTTPPAQTFTGSNVQMGTEMPVPSPTAPAGAGTGAETFESLYQSVIASNERTDVDHHVDLGCAVAGCLGGLEGLGGRCDCPVGKANRGTDRNV